MNREVKKDPLYLALKSAGADEKQTHEAVARQLFINSAFATKDDLQKLETVLSGKIDKVKDDVHTIKVNEVKIFTRLDNIEKNQDRIFVEISDLRKDVSSLKDVVNDVKVNQGKFFTKIENIESDLRLIKKILLWGGGTLIVCLISIIATLIGIIVTLWLS